MLDAQFFSGIEFPVDDVFTQVRVFGSMSFVLFAVVSL